MSTSPDVAAFEREKWETEKAFRERELAVKEREQASREAELDLKRKEHARSQWSNPLIVAILAASIAAIGTTAVAYLNAQSTRQVEAQRAEAARILEMLKTGDPDKAATNLRFLLDTGLIRDVTTQNSLNVFLKARTTGSGPSLPAEQLLKEIDKKRNY